MPLSFDNSNFYSMLEIQVAYNLKIIKNFTKNMKKNQETIECIKSSLYKVQMERENNERMSTLYPIYE